MSEEIIVAYRSWNVSASQRQIKSTGAGTRAWARLSAPTASCAISDGYANCFASSASLFALLGGTNMKAPQDEVEHHDAPTFTCKCGYYAMKHVADIPTAKVYGRVALWGRVIEHAAGFRAQYAYPQVFFARPGVSPDDRRLVQNLAEQYGCEVAPMPTELVVELERRERIAATQKMRGQGFSYVFLSDAQVRELSKPGGVVKVDSIEPKVRDNPSGGFAPKTQSLRAFLGIDPKRRF